MARPLLQHSREVIFGGQLAGTSLDVFIQDQHTPPFQYYLMNEQKDDIILTSPIVVDDTVISVSAGHGFTTGTVGEYMVVREGSSYFQYEVVAVSGNDITINTPVDSAYSLDAQVIRGNIEMDANGSVTPILYRCAVAGEVPVDLQAVVITMQHSTAGDDSKFGDLAEIDNGLFFRKTGTEETNNLGNYSQNQDFREFGMDIEYTDKAGGGNHATNITLDIKKVYGIVIRLDPRLNDCMRATVQDDLTSLIRLRVSVMGQFTLGE